MIIEKAYLFSISIVLIITGIAMGYSFSKRSEKIVFFDLKNTYATFIKQARVANITSAQKELLAKRFNHILQSVLNQYSHNHHVIILIQQLGLAGGIDITPIIQRRIAKEMRIVTLPSIEVNHAH